jgi:hypothetical protein
MTSRKYVAPDNRHGVMRSAFLASLDSEVAYIRYPKSNERASVFHYARAGRQNSEGFGGGYRVKR